ncbi:hypothetical protein CK203_058514 [Vitis vinifera]|uniref:Uncharacterized protein n=1 Tax=Vitis vinifera TaxID=29760 RepID=A0A438FQQ3_VITVI|nr:hypothetical protein CK203_058514 [Vitis vinifera]
MEEVEVQNPIWAVMPGRNRVHVVSIISIELHKPAMAEDLRVASLALEQELCTSEK